MFIVAELQKQSPGAISPIITAHENDADAIARYHTVLKAAATSNLLRHSATLLTETGEYIRSESYGTEQDVPGMMAVIEFQKSGTISTVANDYADPADAEVRYHTILTYAPKSGLAKHGAIMLREDGTRVKAEWYGTDEKDNEE